jgi:hypothetical protein
MQNSTLKFLKVFVFILLLPASSQAQQNNPLLLRGDSLFKLKRYTQSLELYQKLFEDQRYTPAMLLKMAFIEEGLNNTSKAAYYLNIYYLATQDDAVPSKLEELAQKNNLEGYSTSEINAVLTTYLNHHSLIGIILAGLAALTMAIATVQRVVYKRKPVGEFIALCLLVVLFFVHLNQPARWSKAIVAKNNMYMMNGPSAGASVIRIVRDGHRVSILGQHDVWTKVAWGEQEGYIRTTSLLPVKL